MTPDRAIETAADYADAMLTARSAKNLIVLILLLMLLVQMGVFFVARYKRDVFQATGAVPTATTSAIDASAVSGPTLSAKVARYVTGLIDFAGVALSVVLSWVLLLLVIIMLVGRLIGVSRLTAAFIWCLLLIVLLFPWQAFLIAEEFKIPGVLYTWDELIVHSQFGMSGEKASVPQLILKWSRFVVFPAIAILILLTIQAKSNRGLRQALGEADLETSTSGA